jgi:isoleucyl-tRNA synthetase
MLFIVSAVVLERGAIAADSKAELGVAVSRATGAKCERCWRYVSAMSTDPGQAGICGRCQDALSEAVPS